jgi:hypothetical protein
VGRTTFVAWLFVSAAACLVIAGVDASWGWLIGGVILFSIAMFARRQLTNEKETGRATASGGFVGIAILVMLVVMFFLFWLQFAA